MNCPPQVQGALASVDGVESVEIDFANKIATVTCSAGCSEQELVDALKGTRFEATVMAFCAPIPAQE